MRYLVLLVLLFATPAFGAYPYDSVCEISAGGSGTLVFKEANKGLVLTAAHVVATISETNISWADQTRGAKTVFVDIEHDLALLVVDNPPVSAVGYAEPLGKMIVSVGYPYYARKTLHFQVSVGLRMSGSTMWVTHKPVPGFSGGAAFDYRGMLVGVVKAHTKEDGIISSGPAFLNLLKRYKDSSLWVPDASHVIDPPDYNFAPMDGEIRSIPYTPLVAPEFVNE